MTACIMGVGLVTALAEGPSDNHRALVAGQSAVMNRDGCWTASIQGSPGPRELAHRAIDQLDEIPRSSWLLCATSGSDPERDRLPAPIQSLAETLREDLDLDGPAMTVQAACASALVALGMASELVATGQTVLVVAVDCLSQVTQSGFGGLGALTRNGPAPLSEERDGLALGEAAAAFLLSPDRGPVRIRAWGEACDARSLTRPDAEGRGLISAVSLACVESPDLIFAHGTGTPLGDAAEARVLAPLGAPVTGTKGAMGHCLGAAAGVDVAVATECLRTGWVPPLARVRTPILPVVQEARAMDLDRVLVVAAGFGGFDAALLLERN